MWKAQGDGTDQYGDDKRQECRARVEEDPYDDGKHRIGQDVYVEQTVLHHQCRDDTVEHNQYEKQRQTPFAFIIVFPEEVEVEHEAKNKDGDKQDLSPQHQPFFPQGVASLDRLFPQ